MSYAIEKLVKYLEEEMRYRRGRLKNYVLSGAMSQEALERDLEKMQAVLDFMRVADRNVASGQLALLSPPPLPDPKKNRIGRFNGHSGAPDTQRESAILVFPRTGTQRWTVLTAIAHAGENGMTDHELERHLKGRHQTISARRNDLLRYGWVVDSGQRRETDTGHKAAVWVVSEAGIQHMKEMA